MAQDLEIVGECGPSATARRIRRHPGLTTSRLACGIPQRGCERLEALATRVLQRYIHETPRRYRLYQGTGDVDLLHALRGGAKNGSSVRTSVGSDAPQDHRSTTELHCSQCGEKVGIRDVRLVPGPGADETTDLPPRVRAQAQAAEAQAT